MIVLFLVMLGFNLLMAAFMLVAFHCGYVFGRYGISAHEFWKRKRTFASKELI